MTLDELITLTKAGYTKEDIQALTSPAPETPAQPADPEPEKPAEPDRPAEPAAQTQDAVLDALNRLTNTIINHNINGTVTQPAVRTPEDALAEIIAPPRKNKEV